MYTLNTHFEGLLSNLKPPQDRLDAARDLPPLVRDYLKANKDFVTLDPHTRLAGSYAQDMVVGDVKDVDFLVRVPGNPAKNEPEAKKLVQDLRNALDGLPEALGFEGYAGVDLERARRSVHVYIKGRDFHLDVVPCIAPRGFDEALWVPDRGFNKWIQSHPLGYVALLDELNTQHGGKVKRLGRLLKHFRNFQMKNRRPKSYWLGLSWCTTCAGMMVWICRSLWPSSFVTFSTRSTSSTIICCGSATQRRRTFPIPCWVTISPGTGVERTSRRL